jgi:hypothetical protein
MRNVVTLTSLYRLIALFGDGLAGPLITGKAIPESQSSARDGAVIGVRHSGKVSPAECNGMQNP